MGLLCLPILVAAHWGPLLSSDTSYQGKVPNELALFGRLCFWVQAPETSPSRLPRFGCPSISNRNVLVNFALLGWLVNGEKPPAAPILLETQRNLNMTRGKDLETSKLK